MKEIEVTCKLGKELSADEIQTAAVKALGVSPKMKQQLKYRIVRRSIDARNDIRIHPVADDDCFSGHGIEIFDRAPHHKWIGFAYELGLFARR